MRPASRVLSSAVAAAMLVAAFPSMQARAANIDDAQPADADALAQAQDLYQQGRKYYELADYAQALELWKQAYQLLPDEEGSGAIRHALVYNMADAETKQFEVDRDITRLRRSRLLMQEYIDSHADIYGTSPEALEDKANAEQRLAEIEAQISQVEHGAAPAAAPAPTTAPAPAPAPQGPTAAALRRQQIEADPDLKALDRRYTGFIAGGATLIAVGSLVGLVGLGIGLANLTEDTGNSLVDAAGGETTERYPEGTGLAVTLVGVAMIGGGIPLVAIGDVRRRKLRNPSQPLPDTTANLRIRQPRLAPYGHRHGGGAAFSFQF